MNDAFVELPVDDDALTDSSESELAQVLNPSFFSHLATVEDLIASFHRDTIGPLAGVDVKYDSSADPGVTPVIIISDAVSQRTLDCALEKWRVEQEEKELEMRWRATKRVSENWLTKVELVRTRHRARREKFEREREKRKMKLGGGATGSLIAPESITQENGQRVISNSQPPPVVREPEPQPSSTMPPHPELTPSQLAPPASHPTPSAPQSTSDVASLSGSLPHLLPSPMVSLPTSVTTNLCFPTKTAMVRDNQSSASSKLPHAPYDPRTPDLALDAHNPLDSGQASQTTLPESAINLLVPAVLSSIIVPESMPMQQQAAQNCIQQYIDMAHLQMSQSPLPHAGPSRDPMPPVLLPTLNNNTVPMITPDGYSGESLAHCIPHEGTSSPGPSSQPPQLQAHLDSIPPHPLVGRSQSPHSLTVGGWPESSHARPLSPPDFKVQSTPHTALADGSGVNVQYVQTADNFHLNSNTTTQGPPIITPSPNTLPSELTAEEKLRWHVWSLTQSPPSTAADDVLRNPHASRQSNLASKFFKMFPNFTDNKDEVAHVKILTGSPTVLEGPPSATSHQMQLVASDADSNWTWSSLPFTTVPLNETSASSTLAPRAVLVNPVYPALQQPLPSPGSQSVGKHTCSLDQPTLPTPLPIPTSRPMPVIKTQDLPPSLSRPCSHLDSPMSPTSPHTATTALFPDTGELSNSPSVLYPQYMPLGNRLFRIARVANTDVLRPSYWFEPDVMATERMRNVVNLMERSRGWRCPERRTRVFDGDRKARGPDDLASFDLCFGY